MLFLVLCLMIKRCLDATGAVDNAGKQDIIIFGCLFVNVLAGIHKELNKKYEVGDYFAYWTCLSCFMPADPSKSHIGYCNILHSASYQSQTEQTV